MYKFNLKLYLSSVLGLYLILFVMPAGATLINRGNGLIYDNVLNITWLQDGGMQTDVTWIEANSWIDHLNATRFKGYNDWRFPSMSVSGGLPTGKAANVTSCYLRSEVACRDNELSHLYYYGLGGNLLDDLSGDQGPFKNIPNTVWSGTALAASPIYAWDFQFVAGTQDGHLKSQSHLSAWAVRSGDVVTTVPESPTWFLFMLGVSLVLVGKAVQCRIAG